MCWSLRLRTSTGQVTINRLSAETTCGELQQHIADKAGVPAHLQEVLAGFPPKVIEITKDASASIASVGIVNGDSLTVRQKEAPPAASPAAPLAAASTAAANGVGTANHALDEDEDAQLAAAIAASLQDTQPMTAAASHLLPPRAAAAAAAGGSNNQSAVLGPTPAGKGPAPTSIQLPDGSCVVRRVIPSDNSCLFTAVGYVMEHNRHMAQQLRTVIANAVVSDPATYNDGFLGQNNEDYCKWITNMKHWGGGIELAILSAHYGREIDAYDIQTKRCDRYGEQEGYRERVMLIYDGLHYDALAVSAFEGAPEDLDITILQTGTLENDAAESGAQKLVAACHEARQFTDIANFTLRCGVCQIGLKGEKEAVEHAKATGHQNFAEY